MKTPANILTVILSLIFLQAQSQDEEYLLKRIKDHKESVLSVDISPDGKYLITGGEDKALLAYDLSTYECIRKYPDNYFPPRAIEITRVNNIFYGSGSDIKLVDFENNTLQVFEGNSTDIWSVDFAPERNKVTAGSYDYKIKVWDVASAEIVLELEGHKKSTLPVCFSPDEKYIVSGSRDNTVKVWNALTGEEMRTLERHSDNIYDVAFHPSGKYFASASRDKTIRLWDFETGEVVKTFSGHDQAILDIEFLPDGEHLLSASLDGSIRLWQTRTGKMVYTFAGHLGGVNSIAVNDEGDIFASGGVDGQVIVWELSKKIFVEYAFYDELWNEKEGNSLFDERAKGEKKEQYEARLQEAAKVENEIVDRYYKQYLEQLRQNKIK